MSQLQSNEIDLLARERGGVALQVLGVDEETHQQVTLSGTSQRVTLAAPRTRIIEINLTEPAFIAFGGDSVVASGTSRVLPAGSYYYRMRSDQTHVALLQAATGGIVSITTAR